MAETIRAALSGRTDAGRGWLRVQLGQPGVLLLRRLAPAGRGSGGRHVRTHWLGMLICRIEDVAGMRAFLGLKEYVESEARYCNEEEGSADKPAEPAHEVYVWTSR
jgi:hypothetical protein